MGTNYKNSIKAFLFAYVLPSIAAVVCMVIGMLLGSYIGVLINEDGFPGSKGFTAGLGIAGLSCGYYFMQKALNRKMIIQYPLEFIAGDPFIGSTFTFDKKKVTIYKMELIDGKKLYYAYHIKNNVQRQIIGVFTEDGLTEISKEFHYRPYVK